MASSRSLHLARAATLLALLAVPAVARAQATDAWDDTTCREVVDDPARLGVDASLMGKRLKLNAKVHEISGDQVVVYGNDDIALTMSPDLMQSDALGAQGIGRGDNVSAYGYLVAYKPPQRGVYFLVRSVKKRGDDQTLYRDQIAALEKAGDVDGLVKLGKQIEATGDQLHRAKDYRTIARDAYKAALGVRERALRPDDSAGWLALATDWLKLIPEDRKGALERAKKALSTDGTQTPELAALLHQIDALPYGGELVLFEEMKTREGFVQPDGPGSPWVQKSRADFMKVVADQIAHPARVRNRNLPAYFQQAADEKRVLTGMTKEELARAIGFPDDVDRIRKGQDVYDAWTYEGRGTYYFETTPGSPGELFKRPDESK